MARYTRRAQVLLTEEQYATLQAIAEERDKALGALLREAAEELYLAERRRQERSRAARALLSLPATEAPDDYEAWESRYLDERSTPRS